MKKYHIDRAFEVKLLILDSLLAYFQLLGKLNKEQRCPCECMKVTGQKKWSSTFPRAWKLLNLTGNSLTGLLHIAMTCPLCIQWEQSPV